MGLFRVLTEKPWVAAQGRLDDLPSGGSFSLPAAKLGLRMFLGVVTILFLLLIMAYGERMATEEWRPTPQQGLLWLNTALLFLASISLQWARISARRDRIDGVETGLLVGGVFTIAFLAGQVIAWQQLQAMAVFDITSPAVAFFYLITALHALHLLGGLVAWARTTARVWQGFDPGTVRMSVELCAVYWHFLLAVWLILFGLLFSTGDNLGMLLAICGFR